MKRRSNSDNQSSLWQVLMAIRLLFLLIRYLVFVVADLSYYLLNAIIHLSDHIVKGLLKISHRFSRKNLHASDYSGMKIPSGKY